MVSKLIYIYTSLSYEMERVNETSISLITALFSRENTGRTCCWRTILDLGYLRICQINKEAQGERGGGDVMILEAKHNIKQVR